MVDGVKISELTPGLTPSTAVYFPVVVDDGETKTTGRMTFAQLIALARNDLAGAAPGQLDTLDELAAALGDDANFAATVTAALALKAPLAAPAFTGIPTAPTAAPATNTTQIATTAFARAEAIAAASLSSVPVGATVLANGKTAPLGTLKENGASYSSATYPDLFAYLVKFGTATMTIATPGVISWASHGLEINDPVKFTTTGALPTGLTVGTTYYVISAGFTADTFRVAATPGGAAINTTGSQSGVHTIINAPHGCANDLSTFQVPEGRAEFIRGHDSGRGIDLNRHIGSAQADQYQGHAHTNVGSGAYNITAGGAGVSTGSGWTQTIDDWSGAPVANGGNGTPRVGAETRGRNVSKLFCIKY